MNRLKIVSVQDTIFNPIKDPINVIRKKTLQKNIGSSKKRIPITTVPTAPIPVHTA